MLPTSSSCILHKEENFYGFSHSDMWNFESAIDFNSESDMYLWLIEVWNLFSETYITGTQDKQATITAIFI